MKVCKLIAAILLAAFFVGCSQDVPADINLPVLMYHHLAEEAVNPWTITPESFERQMRALRDNDFTPVTLRQLLDYVDNGVVLPTNPVLITFDDGYLSVYQYAFPIMERYGMTGVSFIMGHFVGMDTYKDTGNPMTPRFSFEQARAMAGVMEIQSHTYDMHQWAPFEEGRARENILMWYDEDPAEYEEILRNDHSKISALIYENMGEEVFAVAYPHGIYDELSRSILISLGVRVTFSTIEGINTIVRGEPESLFGLRRFNITDDVDENALIELLRGSV